MTALDELDDFTIEVPSWAYGNSGTRFKVFPAAGVPRNPFEKIADAAQVHAVTGLAPRVSLHIPWDRVDDFAALGTYAKELGVSIGAINSNLFQEEDYKLGSLTHTDERIRAKAIQHHLDCIEIMRLTGSRDLKIWLPDGTNYAGQATSGCCWSTSSSSPTSTRWTSRTGAPRCCTARPWASGRRSCWTPGTTRRVRTSSSS
jgi:L-rhamnose isomerase / sugar isomerase